MLKTTGWKVGRISCSLLIYPPHCMCLQWMVFPTDERLAEITKSSIFQVFCVDVEQSSWHITHISVFICLNYLTTGTWSRILIIPLVTSHWELRYNSPWWQWINCCSNDFTDAIITGWFPVTGEDIRTSRLCRRRHFLAKW